MSWDYPTKTKTWCVLEVCATIDVKSLVPGRCNYNLYCLISKNCLFLGNFCCENALKSIPQDLHITLCHNKPKEENYQLIRLINVSNLEKYKNGIQNHDWTQVNNYNSCLAAFTYFSENIETIFQDAFPVIRVKKRYRNRLPWLTEGLKNAIKHKNKLYKIFMKYETSFNKNSYIQYKNKLTTILRKQEKQCYKLLLETNRNNLKKMWGVIRNVINNCKPSKLNESFSYNNSIITDKKNCFKQIQ